MFILTIIFVRLRWLYYKAIANAATNGGKNLVESTL